MKYAKRITWIGLIAMTIGLGNGFINGDFFSDGADLLANPWGVMSLIDLYVGFVLFAMWIVFREAKLFPMIIWITLVMVLGFFTACLYVLAALYKSKGDWLIFFLGVRKDRLISH